MGCTLNCDPNWLSVFSPRIASTATRALNFGLYCFLVVVIDLSAVNDSRRNLSLLPGLNSGDHYRGRGADLLIPDGAPIMKCMRGLAKFLAAFGVLLSAHAEER